MFNGTLYHGSNSRFGKFEQSRARIVNDYYGGGVAYFTDSMNVAKSYARTMSKRYGGEKFVYEVRARFNKTFDVDDEFYESRLIQIVGSNVEQFARGAGLLSYGIDKYTVMSKLKSGNLRLTGEKVFKGLSSGGINTASARNRLIQLGYDSLRYNGGNLVGTTQHNVYLAYKSSSIEITNRYILTDEKIAPAEQQFVYSFIN